MNTQLFVILKTNLRYNWLSNSMEQNLSWEVESHLANQELSYLLWNLKVHYCVHKSLPWVPVLNQMNPVHNFPFCAPTIHSSILNPCLGLPAAFFPSGFPATLWYEFLISPMHAIFPTHLIFLDCISLIFCEVYKLWSSLLCSVLQPLATSSLLDPNVLFSILFSNFITLWSSHSLRDPYKKQEKL